MLFSAQNKEKGFTLAELLIAMALSGIILGTIAGTSIIQRKSYDIQEQITEMVQTARAAMDMMTREIRMAGYDPTDSAGAGITSALPNSITFTLDITDDNGNGPPDEDTDDKNENITYSLYTADGIQKLGRKSKATANNQPVAEHVQSLEFQYWNESDDPTFTAEDVRLIRVEITIRTSKPDPNYSPNGGYRTYTLTSLITPRNLAFE